MVQSFFVFCFGSKQRVDQDSGLHWGLSSHPGRPELVFPSLAKGRSCELENCPLQLAPQDTRWAAGLRGVRVHGAPGVLRPAGLRALGPSTGTPTAAGLSDLGATGATGPGTRGEPQPEPQRVAGAARGRAGQDRKVGECFGRNGMVGENPLC